MSPGSSSCLRLVSRSLVTPLDQGWKMASKNLAFFSCTKNLKNLKSPKKLYIFFGQMLYRSH